MGIFHTNFKSLEYRPSRPGNSQRFMAGSGTGVAAALGAVISGQLVSLTENVGGDGYDGPYPVGTRRTANCIVRGASGRVARIRFRNVGETVTDVSITALLLGTVDPSGALPLVAMATPPYLPGTTDPITSCSVTINTLS